MLYNGRTINQLIDMFNIGYNYYYLRKKIYYGGIALVVLGLLMVVVEAIIKGDVSIPIIVVSLVSIIGMFVNHGSFISKGNYMGNLNMKPVKYRHMKWLYYNSDKHILGVVDSAYYFSAPHKKGNSVSEDDIYHIIGSFFARNCDGVATPFIENTNGKYVLNEREND